MQQWQIPTHNIHTLKLCTDSWSFLDQTRPDKTFMFIYLSCLLFVYLRLPFFIFPASLYHSFSFLAPSRQKLSPQCHFLCLFALFPPNYSAVFLPPHHFFSPRVNCLHVCPLNSTPQVQTSGPRVFFPSSFCCAATSTDDGIQWWWWWWWWVGRKTEGLAQCFGTYCFAHTHTHPHTSWSNSIFLLRATQWINLVTTSLTLLASSGKKRMVLKLFVLYTEKNNIIFQKWLYLKKTEFSSSKLVK